MQPPELIEFIKAQINLHVSREALNTRLVEMGFNQIVIDQAYEQAQTELTNIPSFVNTTIVTLPDDVKRNFSPGMLWFITLLIALGIPFGVWLLSQTVLQDELISKIGDFVFSSFGK